MSISADLVRGAAAGSAATVAMSALMLAAGRAGLMGDQPPERIVRHAGETLGAEPKGKVADALGSVAHVAFGAAGGAVYGLLPARLSSPLTGMAYGVGIWGSAYMGWVPAFGALPHATRDRDSRVASMIAAHVVFGGALGALDRRWRR